MKVKLVRLRADGEDPNHYPALGLAHLLGVDGKTPAWIDNGLLQAARRGTARSAAQGGDQHWIHRKAAKNFIVENANLIDLRKVDRTWFIDLLGARNS